MYGDNIDKHGKSHFIKNLIRGKCKFPFKYKSELRTKCVKGDKGDWCATSLTPNEHMKTWGYCTSKRVKKRPEPLAINLSNSGNANDIKTPDLDIEKKTGVYDKTFYEGTSYDMLFGCLYLLKKYLNACYLIDTKVLQNTIRFNHFGIVWKCNITHSALKINNCVRFFHINNVKIGKIGFIYHNLNTAVVYTSRTTKFNVPLSDILNYFKTGKDAKNNLNPIKNELSTDYTLNLPNNMTSDKFIDNIKKCKKRFILLPVVIYWENCKADESHVNMIIIDKKQKTIERFDSLQLRYTEQHMDTIDKFDMELETLIQNSSLEYIYYRPPDFCPSIMFQDLEENDLSKGIKSPALKTDIFGYCGIWSLWYAEMRLKYPDLTQSKLITKAIKILKSDKHSLRTFVRSYSKEIINIRKEMMTKFKTLSGECRAFNYLPPLSNDEKQCMIKYIIMQSSRPKIIAKTKKNIFIPRSVIMKKYLK